MVFELASTNLVVELGIVLVVLMGWRFATSEFLGGIIIVILLALIFRLTLTPALVRQAREHADKGVLGRMEGHAAMGMSLHGGSAMSRLLSGRGFTTISHLYVMDWASIWIDVAARFRAFSHEGKSNPYQCALPEPFRRHRLDSAGRAGKGRLLSASTRPHTDNISVTPH
jgi:hypothetical protein